jgi:hypothetical protein
VGGIPISDGVEGTGDGNEDEQYVPLLAAKDRNAADERIGLTIDKRPTLVSLESVSVKDMVSRLYLRAEGKLSLEQRVRLLQKVDEDWTHSACVYGPVLMDFVGVELWRKTLTLIHIHQDRYSFNASSPKTKNDALMYADMGTAHHSASTQFLSEADRNASGNWPICHQSEWTSSQLIHGRRPVREENQTLTLVTARTQSMRTMAMSIRRRYRAVVRADPLEAKCRLKSMRRRKKWARDMPAIGRRCVRSGKCHKTLKKWAHQQISASRKIAAEAES